MRLLIKLWQPLSCIAGQLAKCVAGSRVPGDRGCRTLPLTHTTGTQRQQQDTAGRAQQPAGKEVCVHVAQLVDQLLDIRNQHLCGGSQSNTPGVKQAVWCKGQHNRTNR